MSTLKIDRLEKKVKKLEGQITLDRIQYNDDLVTLNNHWGEKFDMIVGMFQAQIDQAGTITELRKWFKSWTADVNSINADDKEAEKQMDELLEKHGFEFKIKPINVTHKEVLNGYRNARN